MLERQFWRTRLATDSSLFQAAVERVDSQPLSIEGYETQLERGSTRRQHE